MVISNKNTSFIQAINLFVIGIWVMLCAPFYYLDQSMNMLIVLIAGVVIWGIVAFIFFKFYTIKINDDVEVRNIFLRRRYLKSDIIDVEKTSLSPFIFRINISEDTYYFLVDYNKALNAVLSSKTDSIKEELNSMIK